MGRLWCAAPEVIANAQGADPQPGVMWSCGVLLYLLLFHAYPFEHASDTRDGPGFQKVCHQQPACWHAFCTCKLTASTNPRGRAAIMKGGNCISRTGWGS